MYSNYVKTIVLLIVYLAILSCAINPVTGQKEIMLVSENQEIDIGREFYPSALWGDLGGGGEYKDEKLKSYLRDIVLRIHQVSHRPNLPVDFAIQNSSVPNAWAIPGHVVITRGLLAGLDNEAEFVFVMGHEMGHVAARHSARQMSYGILQQFGLGVAGLALQGKEYADFALGVGAIGSGLLLLKYGRDDELEADRLGIQYMARIGYDPKQAISAHRNLEQVAREYMQSVGKDPQEKGFFEDILSTHPRTSVRIDELQSMVNKMQPYQLSGDGIFRQQYQEMIADLKGTNRIYRVYYDRALAALQKKNLNEAESLVSRAISADQGQPSFHSLKGFIRLRKREYAEAEHFFDEALRCDSGYEPAYRGKGTSLYFRERYSEGVGYLKKSLTLYPQDALSHYFLGLSYYKLKNYRSAIPHLQMFSEVKPNHPEIHGVLGICHENAGDLSSAYSEYVLQVRVAPNNDMGRHAASRVTALKPRFEKKSR